MGLKASIHKRWLKVVSRVLQILGRAWSRYPFVEICSVHLGHTIFESAYFLQHRPLLIFWRKPVANCWLVGKLSAGVRFPVLQAWLNRKMASGRSGTVVSAVHAKKKVFSDQYFLMNLGFNCLPGLRPKISFTPEETEEAEAFFRSKGLKKGEYACFCIRDESYYQQFRPDLQAGSAADFEFRNAKTKNYEKAAKFLRQKGIRPVLMGFSTETAPEVFLRPALFPEFRPWIEAYLFRECLFCVGMMTGTTLYASLFDRPVLWSDAFWRGAPVGGRKDLVLPKKVLRRISTDRRSRETEYAEINLKEWVQLGPPPDNDWSHFSKKGYECRACSSDQILGGVKDMLASLSSGRQFPSREARTLHRDFSRLHLRATKKLGHPPTRLAPSWARANRKLLQTKNSSYAKFWLGGQNQSDLDLHDLFQKRETSRVLRPKKTSQESRQI